MWHYLWFDPDGDWQEVDPPRTGFERVWREWATGSMDSIKLLIETPTLVIFGADITEGTRLCVFWFV